MLAGRVSLVVDHPCINHRSITVTMDVYAHLFPALNQDLADHGGGVPPGG